ncbi:MULTISPECIES: MBL fold metallo-hydrolase [unclassified Thermosynechococcus]|uniref:MBL fold metallo-hydrolase n=1 Tax=unclassified Thermosynechococcus TaxID=2622553 RepID=UPI0026733BA7|nr:MULTISPECIES: MBL fold metallo-hydrolase [unclassified Thermosynechococcus]MDR5640264.1 MBL fold metallo-hydrolase [Thermosynechococcus sp. PP42]MDR7923054.1 MBL fold metallo-hydrolase [Thermosynechococcus sp. HY213]WKT81173.1 MBL fold metallo-hydrolase [Thermosynechococcus sp. PP45]WNC24784.1 MBL fold metallo-hydrolase [Thermosynechococcus sp. PP551]WNC27361.1 MBL fold metallo-hydrolase [Thermosynechococcus sp. PP555]
MIECLNYGVGHADEGVCIGLGIGTYRILLDCGVPSLDVLPLDEIEQHPFDLVLCSHAHADHAQSLLALHRRFPHIPIYASEVTTQLLPLNWPHETVPPFCRALPWRSPVEFGDGLTAELFPAGHLPGAAVFALTYQDPNPEQSPLSVVYTGDFFLSHTRFTEGLPLADLRGLQPDVLIIEASLGTARHPHRRQQENQLAERIRTAVDQGYNVLLPLPPLGTAQEILILLRSHHLFTGQPIQIWVTPAIARGCDAYLTVLPHLPTAIQNFAQHQSLFWDQRVKPQVQPLSDLAQIRGAAPTIVLVEEDQDLRPYLAQGKRPWLVLYPRLRYGQPFRGGDPTLASLPNVEVDTFLLSLHADGPATTQLIHNIRPQHVVLIHGDPNYLADLASLNELSNRYHLHTPTSGSTIQFPIGQLTLSTPSSLVQLAYEGEVSEWNDEAMIRLPASITTDPRWRRLADTGFVLASWQGEQLLIRGMTPKEVLGGTSTPIAPDQESCFNCQFYRGQRCWNEASALYNFKVAPEGYCPAFERAETQPEPES